MLKIGKLIDFCSSKSSTVFTIPFAVCILVAPTTVPLEFIVELPATVDGDDTEGFSEPVGYCCAFFSAAFSAAAASLLFYLSIKGSSRKWKSL